MEHIYFNILATSFQTSPTALRISGLSSQEELSSLYSSLSVPQFGVFSFLFLPPPPSHVNSCFPSQTSQTCHGKLSSAGPLLGKSLGKLLKRVIRALSSFAYRLLAVMNIVRVGTRGALQNSQQRTEFCTGRNGCGRALQILQNQLRRTSLEWGQKARNQPTKYWNTRLSLGCVEAPAPPCAAPPPAARWRRSTGVGGGVGRARSVRAGLGLWWGWDEDGMGLGRGWDGDGGSHCGVCSRPSPAYAAALGRTARSAGGSAASCTFKPSESSSAAHCSPVNCLLSRGIAEVRIFLN